VRCQLYAALDENYLTEPEFRELYERSQEISRLISGFMAYLQRSELRGNKYKTQSTAT
jgi:hypothetical protein